MNFWFVSDFFKHKNPANFWLTGFFLCLNDTVLHHAGHSAAAVRVTCTAIFFNIY